MTDTQQATEYAVTTRRYDRPHMHPRFVYSGGFIRPGGKRATDLCKHTHLTEQDARACAESRLTAPDGCTCSPNREAPLHAHECPARPRWDEQVTSPGATGSA